jgi:hypothetical protein
MSKEAYDVVIIGAGMVLMLGASVMQISEGRVQLNGGQDIVGNVVVNAADRARPNLLQALKSRSAKDIS